MAKNRIKLNICGVHCALITEESEEYMKGIAKEVESTMVEFIAATGTSNRELAAVTTALSFCDEAKKAQALNASLENAEAKITELEMSLKAAEIKSLQNKKLVAEGSVKNMHLKNPLRPMDACELEGMVSFFEKNDNK